MANIISFEDPTDGIERIFSFSFEKPQDEEYVYYSVKSVRPNSDFPERENQWYFSKDNLVAALSSVRPGRSSTQFSEMVSASTGTDQRYKSSFVADFMSTSANLTPAGGERDPRATPPVRDFETPMGIEVYKEFTFRFPKTRRFSIAPPSIQFETTRSQEASIVDYIDSDILASELLEFTDPSDAERSLFTTFNSSQRGGDVEVWLPFTLFQPLGRRAAIEQEEAFFAGQSVDPALEAQDAEATAAGLTEEQKKSNLTINEQAILLFRVGDLMEENKSQRSQNDGDRAYYDRFACLDYRDSQKAANVSNHVTSTTHLSPIFDKLKPIHFSSMIPKIRLFKSYLPADKKTRRDADRPRELVEFEFEEYADADILKSSLSTNTGVGIVSFDWSFDGENQFTAERFVKASLKLRAQSIDALDKKIKNSTTGQEYSFTDLVLPPPVYREVKKENNKIQKAPTDRKQFETRVAIEYGVLNKKSEIWNNDNALLKAVESLRLDMNLTLYTHELDLQSDGTVMVSLNFIGRVDASSTDPNYANILSTRTELEELDGTTEQKMLLLEERNVMLNQAASFEQEAKDLEEREKALQEALKQPGLTSEQKQKLEDDFASVEGHASASELTAEIQRRNLIYGKDLSDEEYLERVSSEFDKVLLYQRLVNGLMEKNNVKVIRISPDTLATDEPLDIGTTGQPIVNEIVGEVTKDAPRTREQNIATTEALSQALKSSVKPLFVANGDYFIKYFYFGDLVDVALDGMLKFSKDRRNDIRTLLGPIEIEKNKLSSTEFSSMLAFQNNGRIALTDLNGVIDPDAEKSFNKKRQQDSKTLIKQKLGTAGKEDKIQIPTEKIVVNLADVPISLNLFLSWFAENVANNGVYSYSFQKFMVDSIRSLIVSALRADSTKLILPKQKRTIVTTPFESASPVNKPDVFGFIYDSNDGLIVKPQKKGLLFVEDKLTGTNSRAASLPVFIPEIQMRDPNKYMADYLLVYAESVDYTRSYNGTPQEYRRDLNEGIYHLHAGRDAGVVKEVKLSAVNFEGYEEMMMLEAKKQGLPNKKRVYSANVTMNGVPIFRPGQKVYLNPAAYGSLATLKSYGLVGYYSVVRTSSMIESGQYQTTLECVFLGTG